jgi:hypothetical protein
MKAIYPILGLSLARSDIIEADIHGRIGIRPRLLVNQAHHKQPWFCFLRPWETLDKAVGTSCPYRKLIGHLLVVYGQMKGFRLRLMLPSPAWAIDKPRGHRAHGEGGYFMVNLLPKLPSIQSRILLHQSSSAW